MICLGLSEHIQEDGTAYPFGPISIFKLAKFKTYFLYPISGSNFTWVFLVNEKANEMMGGNDAKIYLKSDKEIYFGDLKLPQSELAKPSEIGKLRGNDNRGFFPEGFGWSIVYFNHPDLLIPQPGEYEIILKYCGKDSVIGKVVFGYRLAPPLTSETIKAIESDPGASKTVMVEIACKNCGGSFKAYTGIDKNSDIEKDGYIWQYDINEAEKFQCKCGQSNHSTKYIKGNSLAL